MPKMDKQLSDAIDVYRLTFREPFPLMQATGNSKKIIEDIMQCVRSNKKAEEMWPEQYGACTGKYF